MRAAASVFLLTLLTACAGSGALEAPPPDPLPAEAFSLPPVPADIVACLTARGVAPPPAGKGLDEKQAADLIARLKNTGDGWQACGLRLVELWRAFESPQGPTVISAPPAGRPRK